MSLPRVINLRAERPKGAVYVGRPSKWGNPFITGRDGTRDQVVRKHREWLCTQPDLLADLHELRGKDLACFCAPLSCHADVLLEMANEICPTCGKPTAEDSLVCSGVHKPWLYKDGVYQGGGR